MTRSPDASELRRRIVELTREYHAAASSESSQPYVPGLTRVPYAGRVFDDRELVNAVEASLDFWLTYGRYSEEFERRFAAYLGVRHAFLVNSGSSANLLALSALTSDRLGARRLSAGDEVITVAAGFPTTVAPIVQLGAVPVFVDVDAVTANATVEAVAEAMSPRTRAIILAHTLGNPFAAREMRERADEHGVWLIEDNCDALGSEYEGRKTGTFGHIATSSFYPPHHMTMGEGGAACTDDPLLARILLSMRDWGRDCVCQSGEDDRCGRRFAQQFGELPFGYDHKYVYSEWGYNLKVTDWQAAIGVAQLDKLEDFVRDRRQNHHWFRERLSGLSGQIDMVRATPGSDPSWFGCLLTVGDGATVTRDQVVSALESAGVQTRMLFAGNIVRQPVFDRLREQGGFRVVGDLANTDRIMSRSFWFGVYPGLTPEMREHIAATLFNACR